MKKQEEEFIPFGIEWEKEMNKLPKKFIIEMFKESCIKHQELKLELNIQKSLLKSKV